MEKYRFSFIDTESHTTYRLKYEVDGWSSYGVNFGRETKNGDIVKSYTSDFTFIKDDAQYLNHIMFTYGVNRRVLLRVDRMDNHLAETWKSEYVGQVDLTQASMKIGSTTAPIISQGIYVDIDNRYSTDFAIKLDKDFNYTTSYVPQDCEFKYNGNFWINTGSPVLNGQNFGARMYTPPIEASYSDDYFQTPSMEDVDITSNSYTYEGLKVGNCFMQCDSDAIYAGTFNAKFQVDINEGFVTNGIAVYVQVFANRADIEGDDTLSGGSAYKRFVERRWLLKSDATRVVMADGTARLLWDCEVALDFGGYDTVTGVGDGINLSYGFAADFGGNINSHYFVHIRNVRIKGKVRCTSRLTRTPNYKIKCATMKDVFEQLIENINNSDAYVIDNSYVNELDAENIYVTGSIGMRYKGVLLTDDNGNSTFDYYPDEYKIKTNLSEFLTWVYSVFAYSMKIAYDENTNTYTIGLYHISTFYDNTTIDAVDNVDDLVITPYRDVLYSEIECGYNVENVTGSQFDYCTLSNWLTPNTAIEEKKLSIISPYSASMYAIESYIVKNYGTLEENGDSDMDGTIYFIRVMDKNGEKVIERGRYAIIDGMPNNLAKQSAYNLEFSTKRMLMAHRNEIDSWFSMGEGQDLVFNTTEGNVDFKSRQMFPLRRLATYPYTANVGVVSECNDMRITNKKLFAPYLISINAASRNDLIGKIMANPYGRIVFKVGGVQMCGYLAKNSAAASVNPMHEQASQFNIIADKDFNGI